jgi:hypothetical protein
MDLNIGTAFWFASRGQGYLREYSEEDINNFFLIKDNNVSLLRVGGFNAKYTFCFDAHSCCS